MMKFFAQKLVNRAAALMTGGAATLTGYTVAEYGHIPLEAATFTLVAAGVQSLSEWATYKIGG